jgi:hypothetical protein
LPGIDRLAGAGLLGGIDSGWLAQRRQDPKTQRQKQPQWAREFSHG